MRALLQRVTGASVSVEGEEVGRIGKGLVVFVGVANGDTDKDIQYLVNKLLGMRIFADDQERFNISVTDIKGELLVISQFTLMADTRKGRRPSFSDAAPPAEAAVLFQKFVDQVRLSGLKVETGRFQQHMRVEIYNDGPVTVMLYSTEK